MFKDDIANENLELESVFDGIYRKFRNPIMRYVYRAIKDDCIAEELTQEIFLKAFRFKSHYRRRFRISTWLWSIARNTVVDWKRKHRAAAQPVFLSTQNLRFDIEQAADLSANVESALTKKEERAELVALTRSLTDMQRKVLFMRVVDQISFGEIASQLNLTLSSVKCLFFRAKATLIAEVADATAPPATPGLRVELNAANMIRNARSHV